MHTLDLNLVHGGGDCKKQIHEVRLVSFAFDLLMD